MSVLWLAAIVAPSDVGPHPNYPQQSATAAQLMAQLVGDQPILASDLSDMIDPLKPIVEAAMDAIDGGTEGVPGLVVYAQNELLSTDVRAAAAILAAIYLSHDDRHEEAIALLEWLDANFSALDLTSDLRLIRGTLNQQLALRNREIGKSSAAEATRTLELLDGVARDEVTEFVVSPGVSWDYRHTVDCIVERLKMVAQSHIWRLEHKIMEVVRAEASILQLKNSRRAHYGYRSYIEQKFTERLRRSTVRFASSDPTDDNLWASLLHAEIVGSWSETRQLRKDLAGLRAVRATAPGDKGRSTILRLLRHSANETWLSSALSSFRAEGSLTVLRDEARHIMSRRVDRMRILEWRVVRAASAVLDDEDARTAFGLALTSFNSYPFSQVDIEERRARQELMAAALEVASELAVAVGATSTLASALLKLVRSVVPFSIHLRSAVASAISAIEWNEVDSETQQDWATWLNEGRPADDEWRDEVWDAAFRSLPRALVDSSDSRIDPLATAAALLNARSGASDPLEAGVVEPLIDSIVEAMLRTRDQAAEGAYVLGGYAAGQIAAALAVFGDADRLWSPLTDLLVDPMVYAPDKSGALDVLVSNRAKVPDFVRAKLREKFDNIANSRHPKAFGDVVDFFPSAMRLAAAFSFQSAERLMADFYRLAGDGNIDNRIQAARSLEVLSWMGREQVIVSRLLGLQLSHDGAASVRAEAARFLGLVSDRSDPFSPMIESRLFELLGEDGLLVPLMVLRGLTMVSEPDLHGPLFDRVEEVRATHCARGVRLQAAALLAKASPSAAVS